MGVFYLDIGDMSDEKKKMFAWQMTRLLNLGGMVQCESVSMYGRELTLLKPFCAYSGGSEEFHYNYFEDDIWSSAEFDVDSCILEFGNTGSAEFDDVIIAACSLYDAYAGKTFHEYMDVDIIDTTKYIGWINQILETTFSMKDRFSLWENAEKIAFYRLGWKSSAHIDSFMVTHLERLIPEELMYVAGGAEYAGVKGQ